MVEWCKCRARAQHWVEEVRLLVEEMRRALAFNESMAAIWDRRREPAATVDVGEAHQYASDAGWVDGVRAYACKQAHIRRQQADDWRGKFADISMGAEKFLALHTPEGFSIEPLVFLTPEEWAESTGRAEGVPSSRARPQYSTPEGYIDDEEYGDAEEYGAAEAHACERGWGEEEESDWDDEDEDVIGGGSTDAGDGQRDDAGVPQQELSKGKSKMSQPRKEAQARPKRRRAPAKRAQRPVRKG